ncbi:MAG: tRNA threonylcarbamoyladenosine biosynthesis protein TsaB [uncultured Solirubrobacteraceae bacterium]|uniref:tRNA threonylcarbamoyladenosine biosynthesis protein TsaB n=1 Tax=uncultured Solirubrobacteraceae bacterium TaxID=1162706 RepID=A0A6J4SGQ5_9ACTN|nr:MAG: tRNA threonylcarbamoyladenosine biosynthesis protein TsaB [uncultured Solirubrobacteraceae bacterium]
MIVLAFDTATADTAVGLATGGAAARTARHTPASGERPGHVAQLLGLARGLLAEAGIGWAEVERLGVGTGPGSFTGLRIGVATARALAQAGGQELVGVSTLEALARGVASAPDVAAAPGRGVDPTVLACLDARRGEAFVGAWRGDALVFPPRAVVPEALAGLLAGRGAWRAAGDGSVRFRAQLEAAGAHVPPDDSALHHVSGARLCELALEASPAGHDTLEPEYVRAPDAVPKHLR